MDILTVNQMYEFCKELVEKGHGRKLCYVATDEEGNDYRPMWFKPMSDPDEVSHFMTFSCSGRGDHDPSKIVMFG